MLVLEVFVVVLLLLCCQYVELVSVTSEIFQNTGDCSYEDGRFGRIDLSQVGLNGDVPAFRNLQKDDYYYS